MTRGSGSHVTDGRLTIILRPFVGLMIGHATVPSVLGVIVLLGSLQEGQHEYTPVGIGLLMLGVALGFQAKVQHLWIEEGVLHFTDFFGRPRQVAVEEIRDVHFEAIGTRWVDRFGGFPRLKVILDRRDTGRRIYINLSAYRRVDIRKLLHVLADAGLLRDLELPDGPEGVAGDK